MYTRSYSDSIGEIIIPEKYGGTSFIQSTPAEEKAEVREESHNPWEGQEIHTQRQEESRESEETSATPMRGGIGTVFSGVFKNDLFTMPKIGREELLIIATAAFLLFSREGDKECAIMLLLLLFLG